MNLSDLANIVSGMPWNINNEAIIESFSFDTRELKPGACFLALQGVRDGHEFLSVAECEGAVVALVSHINKDITLPQIQVPCVLKAFQSVAVHIRQQFKRPIIALTGSCGKTTVKEMIACMLPTPSFATFKNYNNHLGVPCSLVQLNSSFQAAVLELGANHIGEIEALVQMVRPDVALITNIGKAHLEGFGSIDGVEQAKGEIFEGLNTTGTLVINQDDERVYRQAMQHPEHQVIYVSEKDKSATLFATNIVLEESGPTFDLIFERKSYLITLNLIGRHQVMNALLAIGACLAIGIRIEDLIHKLAEFQGVSGRLNRLQTVSGACIIDDTYNANVGSVKAAVDVLASQKTEGVHRMVIGDLGELGLEMDDCYDELSLAMNEREIKYLYTIGETSARLGKYFKGQHRHFQNQEELISALNTEIKNNDCILLKGSRKAHMESVVKALLTNNVE